VANPSSPYYNSPKYGMRYRSLSNFFLWAWLFHDRDDEEYEEEYVQSNADPSGWFVTALLLVALVGLPIWVLRKRSKGDRDTLGFAARRSVPEKSVFLSDSDTRTR